MKITVISETTFADDDDSDNENQSAGERENERHDDDSAFPTNDDITQQQSFVSKLLESLVAHYRQPIHQETQDEIGADESSPFLRYWMDQMDQHFGTNTKQYTTSVVGAILMLYGNRVRPLFVPRPGQAEEQEEGVAVLVAFYRIVHHGIGRIKEYNPTSSSCSSWQPHTTDNTQHSQQQQLHSLLLLLSSDICTMTKLASDYKQQELDGKEGNGARGSRMRRIILPTLLGLLQSGLELALVFHPAIIHNNSNNNNNDDSSWWRIQARCVTCLLAFGGSTVGVVDVAPPTLRLSVEDVGRHLAYPPPRHAELPPLRAVSWERWQLHSADWNDTLVAEPLVRRCWQILVIFATIGTTAAPETYDDKKTTFSQTSLSDLMYRYVSVVCSCQDNHQQGVLLAEAVRAHLWGRDMYQTPTRDQNSSTAVVLVKPRTRTRLHMGRTITEEITDVAPPYRDIPSRLFAVLQFVRLLTLPEKDERNGNDEDILSHLWPVVYELLGAHRDLDMALGAACVLRLYPHHCNNNTSGGDGVVRDNLVGMLDTIIRTNRQGSVLAVVGAAQRCLLRGDDPTKLAATTHQWLWILNKNLRRNRLAWGVLVGGILPLLHQLCANVQPLRPNSEHESVKDTPGRMEFPGMELGRPGLRALLPLILSLEENNHHEAPIDLLALDDDDDYEEETATMGTDDERVNSQVIREVRLLALLALSNLLIAASPIMPFHGGKIVATTLAFAGLCNPECAAANEREDEERRRAVTVDRWWLQECSEHVAAMALQLGGVRGQTIVEQIVQEKDNIHYRAKFVHLVKTVRCRAMREFSAM